MISVDKDPNGKAKKRQGGANAYHVAKERHNTMNTSPFFTSHMVRILMAHVKQKIIAIIDEMKY